MVKSKYETLIVQNLLVVVAVPMLKVAVWHWELASTITEWTKEKLLKKR